MIKKVRANDPFEWHASDMTHGGGLGGQRPSINRDEGDEAMRT